MTPNGTGPESDRDPRPGGPLQHLDAATRPARQALRSLRRIRFLRGAVLTVAVLLLAVVATEIWTHRPRRKPTQAPPPAAQPDNTTQTLDKFEYTATAMGKLAYRILADKLTGVEGGLHTLQGIRRAEFKLADGRTLTASADHGTFTTDAPGGSAVKGAEGATEGAAKGGNGATGGEGSGTARGHGHVVLEGHVLVTSDAGERLESDRIEYFQAEGTLVSPGRCRFRLVPPPRSSGGLGPSQGEAGTVTYNLSTKVIVMKGGVTIHMSAEGAQETVATSAQARFSADGTSADLDGDARVTRGEEFLAAPHIEMARSEDGDRTRVVAKTGAKGRVLPASALAASTGVSSAGPAASGAGQAGPVGHGAAAVAAATPAAPPAGASSRGSAGVRPTRVAAQTIDTTDIASTGQRQVTLDGAASLEEEEMPGLPSGRTLSARTIVLQEAPRPPSAAPGARTPRTLHAVESVQMTLPPAPGETAARVLRSATLDAVTAPDGSLATADADGTVTLEWGPRRAVSARAHMVGETHVELRGARPVVEEPEHRVVADEIDYETRPSQLTARGSVQTRFVPAARGEVKAGKGAEASGDQNGGKTGDKTGEAPGVKGEDRSAPAPADKSASGALPFTPGVPVDVLSDDAVMKQDEKTAEFSGRVRARQIDRAISADYLLVNDTDKTARADGSVSVRSFREERAPGPAAASGAPTASNATPVRAVTAPGASGPGAASPGTGPVVKIPVQVDADALFHDDIHRTTRFSGHAVYREPGRVLRADTITFEGGSGGTPATTRAEGHVVYEGEGKRGTGDSAIHHEDTKTVTLEGRDRPAQVFETASGRSWRGPSLTWVQAPDSIPVVTGTSGRSRIVGSISSQQRDEVGKPADRGSPR